ncbi:hypothetical protein [Streptomyces sp. GbtcB7]|uniref:hypothetical protein n=1 Tax=Streptomyces sp. GbtcB7 TaxID=2824752 RepID=UPI0020C6D36C|nr:hypothetical protein [Streptomyces sp. GbtcB7]
MPAEVRNALYGYGFQDCPRDNTLLLPATLDGVDEGLARIQAAARDLAGHGFGMNVRPAQHLRPNTASSDHHDTETPPMTLPSTPTDPAGRYILGRHVLDLTDRLNAATSYDEAARLADQVLEPTDGLLERLAEFFEAAAEKAKESEHDDGFDLHDDLQDAAATVRALGEDLHVVVDRMQALAHPPRQNQQAAVADHYSTAHSTPHPPAVPSPPSAPARGRTR